MAIAFVQSTGFQADGVNSANTLLNGVVAGNFLAILVSGYQAGGGPTNSAPTDDKSNTWNTTTAPTANGDAAGLIFYARNVNSGNTTATYDFGTGFYATGEFAEFSGLDTTAGVIDQQTQTNGTSNSPATGSTGTLSQADELVLAVMSSNVGLTDEGIDVPATTGYTNLFVEQDAQNHVAGAGDYKIVAATTAVSAAWGTLTSGSTPWTAKIATFKASTGGSTFVSRTLILGVG